MNDLKNIISSTIQFFKRGVAELSQTTSTRRMKAIGSFFLRVGRKFLSDHCLDSAGSLTFTTLLSIIPTAMIVIWILGSFEQITSLSLQAQEFLLNNLVPEAANQVRGIILNLSERRHKIPIFASMMLLVTALLLVSAIDEKINRIWHAGKRHRPGWRIIYYLLVVTLGPVLLGLSLTLTSYITSMSIIRQGLQLVSGELLLIRLIPPLFSLILLSLVFKFSPLAKVNFKHALLGALISAILFELSKYGFSWYVLQFPNYEMIYGALSFFPIFLLWIYISWCIFLLGVETSFCLSLMDTKGKSNALE